MYNILLELYLCILLLYELYKVAHALHSDHMITISNIKLETYPSPFLSDISFRLTISSLDVLKQDLSCLYKRVKIWSTVHFLQSRICTDRLLYRIKFYIDSISCFFSCEYSSRSGPVTLSVYLIDG